MNKTSKRTIRFAVLDWRHNNKPIDAMALVKKINSLRWDTGDRYYKTSEGEELAVFVDSEKPTIQGQIGVSRRKDLPGTETHGERGFLNLKKGTGLFEASHFIIYINKNRVPIIAYEYNIYAPRISRLAEYLNIKFPNEIEYFSLSPISSRSINEALKRVAYIKKIRLKAYNTCDFNSLSSSMDSVFKSLKKAFQGEIIEITIRTSRKAMDKLKMPSNQKIEDFMSSSDGKELVQCFIMEYIDKVTQKKEKQDLVSLFLKEEVEVKRNNSDSRVVDRKDMYNKLELAIQKHSTTLERIQ